MHWMYLFCQFSALPFCFLLFAIQWYLKNQSYSLLIFHTALPALTYVVLFSPWRSRLSKTEGNDGFLLNYDHFDPTAYDITRNTQSLKINNHFCSSTGGIIRKTNHPFFFVPNEKWSLRRRPGHSPLIDRGRPAERKSTLPASFAYSFPLSSFPINLPSWSRFDSVFSRFDLRLRNAATASNYPSSSVVIFGPPREYQKIKLFKDKHRWRRLSQQMQQDARQAEQRAKNKTKGPKADARTTYRSIQSKKQTAQSRANSRETRERGDVGPKTKWEVKSQTWKTKNENEKSRIFRS